MFEKISILNGAHLAFEVGPDGSAPRKITAYNIIGSDVTQPLLLGTLHVGPGQDFSIVQSSSYLAVNLQVYLKAALSLPNRVIMYNTHNDIRAPVSGLQHLTVIKSNLTFTNTSKTTGQAADGSFKVTTLTLQAGSLVDMKDIPLCRLELSDLNVGPRTRLLSRKMNITAKTVTIEESGHIDLDQGGYEAKWGPGNKSILF